MGISKSLLAAAAGIEIPHEETENLNYEKHELNVFGLLNNEIGDYDNLKESIALGWDKSKPIELYENKIIDGWNRYSICKELDITPTFINLNFENRLDAINHVRKQNSRRNLNKDQKSIAFGKLHLAEIEYVNEQERKKKLTGNQNAKKEKNDVDGNTATSFSNKPNNERHKTRNEFAKAVGVGRDKAQDAINILKNNPQLADDILAGKTTIEENKKKEKKEKIEAKLEEIKAKAEINQIPNNIKLLEGDLFDHINSIPDNSIDLLNTDPPYKILGNDWDQFKDENEFFDYTEKWLKAVIPKVKSTGRIYISFAQWYQYDFYQILKSNDFFGFNFKQNIIWYYKNNNKPSNQKEYRYMYEPIFYLYGKDAPNLNFTPDTYGETHQNVWEIATPQSNFNEGKYHSAQKPLELYRRIIKTGSFDNDTVLDCFAGSGTTGIICKELNRNCILIERDIENIKIIKGRI